MPGPLSTDLRKRVVAAIKNGMSWRDAARIFKVSEASIGRWLRMDRARGSVEPEPMGGPNNVVMNDELLEVLERLVAERPDRTLAELIDALEAETGVRVGLATVVRGLTKLGMTRKKKSLVPTERDSERVRLLRERFIGQLPAFPTERLVFIDETGTRLDMTRTHGRALRGEPVHDRIPRNRGENVTVIASMSIGGIEAVMTVDGGTTTEVFLAFIEQVLAPTLSPGDIVVLDNVGAHRAKQVREALEKLDIRLRYLPPYSPDLNPIEMCFSKLKTYLRAAKARCRSTLDDAIASAIDTITPMDCGGWFSASGYSISA